MSKLPFLWTELSRSKPINIFQSKSPTYPCAARYSSAPFSVPHQPRLSHSKRQQNSAAWRHALAKYTSLGWGELGCWICEAETTHLGAVKILKFQQAGYHIKNITSTLSPRESWSSKRNLDVLYNMLAKSRCIFLEFKWWFPVGYNNPTVTSHLQQSKKNCCFALLAKRVADHLVPADVGEVVANYIPVKSHAGTCV